MGTDQANDQNTVLILGELRGQLRELIHNMKDQNSERAAIARQLAKLEAVPEQLEDIKRRMTALEQDRYRRDGAMGVGAWLMKTPLLGWVVGISVAAWAIFKEGFAK